MCSENASLKPERSGRLELDQPTSRVNNAKRPPRQRLRCVLGMLNSLEVKVLCPGVRATAQEPLGTRGVHVRFMDGLGGGLHPVSAVLPEIFETCAELAATEGHDRIGTMLGPVHSASL